jgi:DNA repair exonuclease SbcCD ATPase subunit
MKIQRIKLKNFRSHKHTVISFERINFIRGMNKSGKSSIAVAIEMALAGRCAVTDEAGKGFEQLIRHGEQTATITLECSTFIITLQLDRSTGRTLRVETGGHTFLGKQAQEWIAENVATPDVVNAAMNAWRFMDSSENEQAALLARVLLPTKLELAPEVSAWLAGSRLSVVERPSLFATIEATHKAIAAARTEVNRKLRDLKAIVEPEPDDEPKAGTVTAQMAERRAAVEKSIATIKTGLPDLQAKLLGQEARQALEAKAKLRERLPELRAALSREQADLAKLTEHLKHDKAGTCPTCNAQLSDEARETLFAPFRQMVVASGAAIERLEKELQVASEDGESAAKQVSVDNANRQQCRDTEAQLRYQQENLEAINATKTLVATATFEARMATYREQVKERTQAETRLGELEKLLDYFGPHGIKAKLITERLGLFTDRVNAVLDWWGYSMEFSIEPYALKLTEVDPETGAAGPPLIPNQLSASERYRLGVAFGVAIADWTGLRLLVADAVHPFAVEEAIGHGA